MRTCHERLLSEMKQERERIISRRGLLAGSAGLFAGAVALGGSFDVGSSLAQDDESTPTDGIVFESNIDVLNYALTLEHLENAFYRDGVPQFDFGVDGYGNDIGAYLTMIGGHEAEHVAVLTQVITDLGGTPIEESTYDFGYTDGANFLNTA